MLDYQREITIDTDVSTLKANLKWSWKDSQSSFDQRFLRKHQTSEI